MLDFSSSTPPVASIVILGWQRAPLLMDCLRALADHATGVPHEVLLVLNEPAPELVTELESGVRGVTVLTFRTNLGFGQATNEGVARARGEVVVLLNDDATVRPRWLDELVGTFDRRPRAGIVGSTFLAPDGALQEAGGIIWRSATAERVGAGDLPEDHCYERRVDYCSAASLAIRRQVWDALGGFDDRFYPAYYEDADLCLRAAELGWETWYQPLSIVSHVQSPSTTVDFRNVIASRTGTLFQQLWTGRLEDHADAGPLPDGVWQALGRPHRVLVVGDDPPLSARYPRTADLVAALAGEPGLHVSVAGAHARLTPSVETSRLGVRVIADLETVLADPAVTFDTVVLSGPAAGDRLDQIRNRLPSARLVFHAEALGHTRLRAAGSGVVRRGFGAMVIDLREPDDGAVPALRDREAALARACDLTVCLSDDDAATVVALGARKTLVLPPRFDLPVSRTEFAERDHVGLIASWEPGFGAEAGLEWFARNVLPRLSAQAPGIRLLVDSAPPPASVAWLDGGSIDFVGDVALPEFLDRVRVVVYPGTGPRIDLATIAAIPAGVPVVARPASLAGLDRRLADEAWQAEDPEEFADIVSTLATTRRAWQRSRVARLGYHPTTRADWSDVIAPTAVGGREN